MLFFWSKIEHMFLFIDVLELVLLIQNRLLQTFLTDGKINKLYLNYLEHPSNQKKEIIEKLFQIHVRKIQLLSYFSKVLHFESQKYDKKIRHINSVNQLILDKSMDGDGTILDLIEGEQLFGESDIPTPVSSSDLPSFFEDKHLYEIVSALSSKQKDVLHLLFVEDLSEKEVAQRLGVTKQSVNKTKIQTLKKIKRKYEGVL